MLDKEIINKKKIKNVLYFAENSISSIQGGGIVVYAVLKDLPPENLLGFFEYRNITPAPEYAERFSYLGQPRFPKLLKSFKQSSFVSRLFKVLFPDYLVQKDFNFVLKQVNEQGFNPEIIYFSGLSLRYLMLAVKASEYFKVPMAILHMDDWPAREAYEMGIFAKLWHKMTVKTMKIAAGKSLASTTNSPRLSEKISKLTGYEHKPANNCNFDLLNSKFNSMQIITDNQIPVITYAGAMNSKLQGETLEIIAGAISELNSEDVKVHLNIYTSWQFAPRANLISVPDAVSYKGHVSREKLTDIYINSDFLLTTVTFNPVNLLLFKNSLSTKLSEYLCVGKPVISVGHPDWHLHEYINENNCGFAIFMDENYKRAAIKEQIKRLIMTPKEELTKIGLNNRSLWEKAHDVRVMSKDTRLAIGLNEIKLMEY
ncbi:MAG: hypothetical protein PHC34_06175 [Candidatus Gastranaerophilales bacterium]|nr:hypothetical protein [Candidatus Gastranaerophilales bacterium]